MKKRRKPLDTFWRELQLAVCRAVDVIFPGLNDKSPSVKMLRVRSHFPGKVVNDFFVDEERPKGCLFHTKQFRYFTETKCAFCFNITVYEFSFWRGDGRSDLLFQDTRFYCHIGRYVPGTGRRVCTQSGVDSD